MMNLYKPTIGPLLGYRKYFDSSVSQKVLVRGIETVAKQTCYILIREIDGDFSETYSYKLKGKLDDYTALIELKGLPLDTKFEYKATIAKSHSIAPDYNLLKAKDCYRGTFETRNKKDTITSFVFGSCCHFPIIGLNKSDDAAFKSILQQRDKGMANDDFLLMLGDQIYGDHRTSKGVLSTVCAPKKSLTFEHYLEHYYKAFRKSSKRKLMSSIPTYMMFDDHEVHNDWGSNKFLRTIEDYKVLRNGLKAYNIYQVSHPNIIPAEVAIPNSTQIKQEYKLPEAKYYYEYSHGKCGFFVMDTRFNKVPLNENQSNESKIQLISAGQMKALKKFLKDKSTLVKFVATSVPMAPDSKDNNKNLTRYLDVHPEDRWQGYAKQRKEILDFINNNVEIKNVIFLSGDVHVSYASNVIETENSKVIAKQITSSAFNWGIGLNDSNFDKVKSLEGTNGLYKPENLTGKVITKDNFCRLVVKTNKVDVMFYHSKTGKCLRKFTFLLD